MNKYTPKTQRVTCGPGESAADVARQQWGDDARVVHGAGEREELERDGYNVVGAVSVRASQADYTVMAPRPDDDICPECGGHVVDVDHPAEVRRRGGDVVSYCRRCGQEWDNDGNAKHGDNAGKHWRELKG